MGATAASKLIGIPSTDIQPGYRLITAEVLQGLTLGAAGYEGELELLLKACKRGHTVVEIAVTTHYIKWKASKPFPADEEYVGGLPNSFAGILLEGLWEPIIK